MIADWFANGSTSTGEPFNLQESERMRRVAGLLTLPVVELFGLRPGGVNPPTLFFRCKIPAVPAYLSVGLNSIFLSPEQVGNLFFLIQLSFFQETLSPFNSVMNSIQLHLI